MMWIWSNIMNLAELIFIFGTLYFLNYIPTSFRGLWSEVYDKWVGFALSNIVIPANVILESTSHPIIGYFYQKILAILFVLCIPCFSILIIRRLESLIVQVPGANSQIGERNSCSSDHLLLVKNLSRILKIVVIFLVIALSSVIAECIMYANFHANFQYNVGNFDGCFIDPLMILAPLIGILLNLTFLSKTWFQESRMKNVNANINRTSSISERDAPIDPNGFRAGATQNK